MFLFDLLTKKTAASGAQDKPDYALSLFSARFASPAAIAFLPGFYMTPVIKR